jgi:IS1 family transposase
MPGRVSGDTLFLALFTKIPLQFVSPLERGIERLLMERISLRGICRAVGVTLKWLLGFLVQCFATLPDHLHVQPISYTHDVLMQRLEVEADELASFVQKKAHKQWVWIAMDAKTRQIIAFHVGDRSHTSAEHLWAKIPQAYRHHATFYTDRMVYEGDSAVQHKAISKLARKTNHIEQFNNTLRQRVSRLVRDVIFFRSSPIVSVPSNCSYAIQPDGRQAALHGYHYLIDE